MGLLIMTINRKNIINHYKKLALESKLGNNEIELEKDLLAMDLKDDLLYEICETIENSINWDYIFIIGNNFTEKFIDRFYKNVTTNLEVEVISENNERRKVNLDVKI